MPSTPSVHNHGGTGEQEARLQLALHHFEQKQDQPDYPFITTINSGTVNNTAATLNDNKLCS